MKRLLPVVLIFLNTLCLFGKAPDFSDSDDPLTDTASLNSGFLNPSLLGFDTSLQFSYMTDYRESRFGSAHLLSFRWAGAGVQIAADEVNGSDYQRLKLGYGYHWDRINLLIGGGVSWYFSDDVMLDKLRLFEIGFSKFFSRHFLLSVSMKDVVLSRSAGGLAEPEYSFGAGLQLFDGRLALHGSFSLTDGQSIADATKRVALRLQPFSGVTVGAGYLNSEGNSSFSSFFSVQLDSFGAGTKVNFDRNSFKRSYFAVEYSNRPVRSLLPDGNKMITVDIAGDFRENPVAVQKVLSSDKQKTFLDLLLTLEAGLYDKTVSGVYLRIRDHRLSYGRTEELIGIISRYRATGRQVVAYLEDGAQLAYLLAAQADLLVINPAVELRFRGAGAVVTFLKGFLDKLGLKAQLYYRGPYKGAPQQLTAAGMPEPLRRAEQQVLNSLQNFMVNSLQQSARKLKPDLVGKLFQQGSWTPAESLKSGLADRAGYQSTAENILYKSGHYPIFWEDYADRVNSIKKWGTIPAVAVVHISGSIVNGSSSGGMPLFVPSVTGADDICSILQFIGSDDSVKAVVIRVHSPGGDLVASDKIWHAVDKLAVEKPLIISFGSIAASGGYYLAAGSKQRKLHIIAPKSSLTGSIGVFTGKVSWQALKRKLGMNSVVLQTGPHSVIDSPSVDYSATNQKAVVKMLDYWYKRFAAIVKEGRRMSAVQIQAAAGGRVWTGMDAKKLGLIDSFGSVLDAVGDAAQRASLQYGEYRVTEYPERQVFGLVPGSSAGSKWLWELFDRKGNLGALLLSGKPLALVPWLTKYY